MDQELEQHLKYDDSKNLVIVAYFMILFGGWLGFRRFYLGKFKSASLMLFVGLIHLF